MLQELGSGVGYFKAGLYGNAGSGKTHTATVFAVGLKKHLKLPGPIAFFDTETGVEYVAPMIREATGKNPVGVKSRALADAIAFLKEAEKIGAAVAIVDSVTHIWEEVQASYLKQLNEQLQRKGRNPKTTIEWQDRGPLNGIWQRFTDAYVNSQMHIIICGRAQNVWERKENEDTGKTELNVKGTKMRTQSELAYEPSFLAEMAREQKIEGGVQSISRVMTVLKDRFRKLDAMQFPNPTFEAILPHIQMLTPGAANTVDTSRETALGVTDDGDTEWSQEKKARVILCEEIQGTIVKAIPGMGAQEKQRKAALIEKCFGTLSWTAVEAMPSERLRRGLTDLTKELAAPAPQEPAPATQDPESQPAKASKKGAK